MIQHYIWSWNTSKVEFTGHDSGLKKVQLLNRHTHQNTHTHSLTHTRTHIHTLEYLAGNKQSTSTHNDKSLHKILGTLPLSQTLWPNEPLKCIHILACTLSVSTGRFPNTGCCSVFIYCVTGWMSLIVCGNENLAANTPCCKSAPFRSGMFLIYTGLRLGGVYTMGQ